MIRTDHASGEDLELFSAVSRDPETAALDWHSREQVRALCTSRGIDFATAALYTRLLEIPRHADLLARVRTGDCVGGVAGTRALIVPGALYDARPHLRADVDYLLAAATAAGLRAELVPVNPFGCRAENAEMILEFAGRSDSPTLLISASKGGADIAAACAYPEAATALAGIFGWIDLCGILHGTPFAEWLTDSYAPAAIAGRWYCRLRGWDLSFAGELHYRPAASGAPAFQLPEQIRMVSVTGFPCTHHLRGARSLRNHRRLARSGPNDGLVMLPDLLSYPGRVLPVWGDDHYLRRARHDGWIGRVIALLMQEAAA